MQMYLLNKIEILHKTFENKAPFPSNESKRTLINVFRFIYLVFPSLIFDAIPKNVNKTRMMMETTVVTLAFRRKPISEGPLCTSEIHIEKICLTGLHKAQI